MYAALSCDCVDVSRNSPCRANNSFTSGIHNCFAYPAEIINRVWKTRKWEPQLATQLWRVSFRRETAVPQILYFGILLAELSGLKGMFSRTLRTHLTY